MKLTKQEIIEAIKNLSEGTKQETLDAMEDIRDVLDQNIDALKDDLGL